MTYAELLADNQRLRKRIIELEQENARLKGLGEPLLPESKSPTLESHKSLTEEEKEIELRRRVNLFRSLFRGREDVYAQRFVTKDGKEVISQFVATAGRLSAKHINTNVKDVPTEIWCHWMMLSSDVICIKEQKKLTL